MKRSLGVVAALLLGGGIACADPLVSWKHVGTVTIAHANQRLRHFFPNDAQLHQAKSNIELYKIQYRSVDAFQKPHTLSGLVAIPHGGATKRLEIVFHGTIADRRMSPSRFTGGGDVPEAEVPVLAFASDGYAVAMPDYLGLGDDRGVHPYPLAAINYRSGTDMIAPVRSLAKTLKAPIANDIGLAGYSEGGAVAMFAAKVMQSQGKPVLTAALSGPYDLSRTSIQFAIAPTSSIQASAGRLYLVTYAVHSFSKLHPQVHLDTYLKPAYAKGIAPLFNAGMKDQALIQALVAKALLVKALRVEGVLQPRFVAAIRSGDFSDRILAELRKSDCYDWRPAAKLLLVNVADDAIVSASNGEKAENTMRQNGATGDTVRLFTLRGAGMNHITGMAPAYALARRFFDGGFAALPWTGATSPANQPAVSGAVTYRERVALPPNAHVHVWLEGTEKDAQPQLVAKIDFGSNGRQVPLPFRLPYNAAVAEPDTRYSIRASIEVDGRVTFSSPQNVAVSLSRTGATGIHLVVTQVPAQIARPSPANPAIEPGAR